MPHLPLYLQPVFFGANVVLTIFAPYLLLRFYIFATFVQIKSQATL